LLAYSKVNVDKYSGVECLFLEKLAGPYTAELDWEGGLENESLEACPQKNFQVNAL